MDVHVTVRIGAKSWAGGVTLVVRDSDGEWAPWGSPDHWLSSELLEACEASPDRLEAMSEIESAARSAIDAPYV